MTYTYDTENLLRAVRQGGALLMAATYDGDGNRVFQEHRTVMSVGIEKHSASPANSMKALSHTLSPVSLLTSANLLSFGG